MDVVENLFKPTESTKKVQEKIYLSMPITGYDPEERIERAKNLAVAISKRFGGLPVITPFTACPYNKDNTYGKCMVDCLKELLDCTCVVFDVDYEKSRGCKAEKEVADACEFTTIFIDHLDIAPTAEIELVFKNKS